MKNKPRGISPIGIKKDNPLLDKDKFFSVEDIKPHPYDMVTVRDEANKQSKGWWTGDQWEVRPKIGKIVRWQPFLRWDTAAGRSRLDHKRPKWKNFLDR